MSLNKRGGIWHYSFYVAGKRHRGSTETGKQSEARIIESKAMARAEEGASLVRRKPPTLREFADDFLAYKKKLVESHRLAADSLRYYQDGWRLLSTERIAAMRMDRIRTPDAAELFFSSPSYTNRALRTLRCLLFYAKAVGVLGDVPKINCLHQPRRERMITPEEEKAFLSRASQTLADVMIAILDAGPRPSEVLALRWENVYWMKGEMFIPRGKTDLSRGRLPMSARMNERMLARWQVEGKPAVGWTFPSIRKSRSGHRGLSGIEHEFQRIREAMELGNDVVLYCARHTFATSAIKLTGNVVAVSQQLGHANLQTTMIYTHRQGGEQIRDAIDSRNRAAFDAPQQLEVIQ